MDRLALSKQLSIDEDRRKRIYVDTKGKITGGVGRNLTDRGFSEDEIDLMLKNDIDEVEKQLDAHLPWWRKLNDARQNVIANMCFNMGIDKLLGFKKTLELMNAGRYDAAALEMMDSDWAKQVHGRANRLSDTMRKGVL